MSPKRSSLTPIERVLARSVAGPGGCLLWTGAKQRSGYGQLDVSGRRISVHRIAYEAFKGGIPEGLEIDHLCRVRNCVNPHHLEAVPHIENLRRALHARVPQTHCKWNHALTPENVVRRKDGRNQCRECKNAYNRAYDARRKEAHRA